MKTIGRKVVDELPFGVYVWQMPDGRWVGDDQGNFLCIASERGDQKRIAELTAAVRSYGVEEGAPHFLAGHRKINDEQYEEQKQRMKWGLVPDPDDIGALVDEMKAKKK